MSGQQVMGYFTPTVPQAPTYGVPAPPPAPYGQPGYNPYGLPPAAPGGYSTTPSVPGQAPVATWDTWVPTSSADPYVAGLRTSASAMAAVTGASRAAINARFSVAKALKMGGGRVSSSAARFAGRAATKYKLPKGMQAASSVAQKAQYTQGIRAGLGSAFRHTFLSIGNVARAVGGAAILAIPMALVTNFLDFQAGKINEKQRNALIVADAAGYTVTGASATLVGGFVGSTFLGPGFGTLVGIAAGFGLGWVYEKFVRPQWGEWVHNALYANPTPVQPPMDPNLLPK